MNVGSHVGVFMFIYSTNFGIYLHCDLHSYYNFALVLHFSALVLEHFSALACVMKAVLLFSQSEWRNFFMCIMMSITLPARSL